MKRALLFPVLMFVLLPAGASGIIRQWQGTISDDWYVSGNWNPSGGPNASDMLQVYSGTPETTMNVMVSSGGSMDVAGTGTSASFGGYWYPGFTGNGYIYVRSGASLSTSATYMAYTAGSNGYVYVMEAGTNWTNSGLLVVGLNGDGDLGVNAATVSTGGASIASQSGSSGSVNVGGSGLWTLSDSLYVGGHAGAAGGTGWLTVADDGQVTVGDTLKVWDTGTVALYGQIDTGSFIVEPGGTFTHTGGTLTVDGGTFDPAVGYYYVDGANNPTLRLINGAAYSDVHALYVGDSDDGTLILKSGATISSHHGKIGVSAGVPGQATINGPGSSWTYTTSLHVGEYGNGTMAITNGGSVSGGSGEIGYESGSSGSVSVSGAGSAWTCGTRLFIGGSVYGAGGTGALVVDDGGEVNAGIELKIWDTGTLELLGGAINTGSFIVEPGGTFTHTDGTLTVDGGTFGPGTAGHTIDGVGNPRVKLINGASAGFTDVAAVGDVDDGTLLLQSGATVTGTTFRIGSQDGSNGQLSLGGSGSSLTGSGNVTVGRYGTGALAVTNGAAVSNDNGYIGCWSGSAGSATVSGAGSTWTTAVSLYVGGSGSAAGGTGSLTVQNNGEVNVGYTLKVWDTGTVELLGSEINTGSFIVEPGGTFTHTGGTLTVDGGTFGPGTAGHTIDGTGNPTLKLINGASAGFTDVVAVGDVDDGTLILESGATVSGTTFRIGSEDDSNGQVSLDGSGSSLTGSANVNVGRHGTGALAVTNGADVSSNDGLIGCWDGSDGQASIDGTGSTWTNSGILCVGYYGSGVLIVRNGGAVSSDTGRVGDRSGSLGAANVLGAGSTWTNTNSLDVGAASGATGVLSVQNGGEVAATNTVKIWPSGTIALDGGLVSATTVTNQGLLVGAGDVQADLVNEGTLAPGLSAGVLAVDGDFTQDPAGTLKIELAGSTEHDVLEVTGTAELEGHLEVMPVVGFLPSYGETFTILTAGVLVTGEFATVNGPVVEVTYNPTDVVITTTLMGDANLDGFVAGEDYTIWADNYQDCGMSWVEGDFNGDGCVNGSDYTIWADNYTGRGGSSVPEPATLWLLAVGLARLILRRRK